MKLTLFYLPACPYCKQAKNIMAELFDEHPEYKEIQLEEINELTHPLLIKKYDYYRVPCFFDGMEKLYEADPADPADIVKTKLDKMFSQALKN